MAMMVTGGNNRKIHAVKGRITIKDGKAVDLIITECGLQFPSSPQTTQKQLPKCKSCWL